MAKHLLSMFLAGLLVGIAVNVTAPVRDWFVMAGALVGVALGTMAIPALISLIRAGVRKARGQPAPGFITPLWGVWAIFAFMYVWNAVINLRGALYACSQ